MKSYDKLSSMITLSSITLSKKLPDVKMFAQFSVPQI